MAAPDGFRYEVRKNGDIVIFHRGVAATTLRSQRATEFLDEVAGTDGQDLMARLTGNYKRGNERQAAKHPRNRGR